MEDEFEIMAFFDSSPDGLYRERWTRRSLSISKEIANRAINELRYHRAVVRNIYGGTPSDVLYEAKR